MMNKQCETCKYRLENCSKSPCKECRSYNNWEDKMTPDYSFNADIIAALKDGREVWTKMSEGYKPEWLLVNMNNWNLKAALYNLWSLTKPKEKVKKWQFICKMKEAHYEITANHFANIIEASKCYNGVIEPYLPSEEEFEL